LDKEQLKINVSDCIDKNSEKIIQIGRTILKKPELGYREFETANLVKTVFQSLSIKYQDALAVTGVKGCVKGKTSGKTVAIMGELDALICPNHPFADPCTGAAHACGHNAQIAAMLGSAIGLIESGSLKWLDGTVAFVAVPAEEGVDLEYRRQLQKQGLINYFGGKQEMIRLGAFEDIDIALMVHSACILTPEVYLSSCSNTFISKYVRLIGKEAHAGGEPYKGVNALNAAAIAMMCINAQRETFKDDDHIRVHSVMTKGGDSINIVPADVRMETCIRGHSLNAVMQANDKVNRAIRGAAYAVGASAEITDYPGYMSLLPNKPLGSLFADNARQLVGEHLVFEDVDTNSTTDVGDVSNLIPIIQPAIGGFSGSHHQPDFSVSDENTAYILPAKLMAMTAIDLLWDNAREAKKIMDDYVPKFNRNTYLEFWNSFGKSQSNVENSNT
jgi:amidohydrolase